MSMEGFPRATDSRGQLSVSQLSQPLPGASGALFPALLILLQRGWAVTGVTVPQLTADRVELAHQCHPDSCCFSSTHGRAPRPQTWPRAPTSRLVPLLFSLPQMSFPSTACVQSYPLFKAQHKSHLLRTFLNAHPSPTPAKPGGDLSSQTHRTWPILFSWSSSGYPGDSCLYGSVLSLMLIHLHFPTPFSTLTTAGQRVRLNINLLNEHMNE